MADRSRSDPLAGVAAADTIFALSSGAPPAAIGIIRVSGARAGEALAALAGRLPLERRASYVTFRDPVSAEILDRGLALWFPGVRTATGEPLAEMHIHGGRAVAAAMLAALARVEGLRPALPGEFTRRAFANGRIDLAEAEGLADLLAAETEHQRRAALDMAGGALSRQVDAWRVELLGIAAQVEAGLDFADEEDVPADERAILSAIVDLESTIGALLARPTVERLRDGIRVVLAGPPNAGKSTLLNALVQREAAIVSSQAGTTRDVIEVPMALSGTAFLFSDTAGLRESGDVIERVGVERAEAAMQAADLILWLGDPSAALKGPVIRIGAQCDIVDRSAGDYDVLVSARTGEGLSKLIGFILREAAALLPRLGEVVSNQRQRTALHQAVLALRATASETDMLVVAEHLRVARAAIDQVTGRSGVEDMLDALFGRFCIGK